MPTPSSEGGRIRIKKKKKKCPKLLLHVRLVIQNLPASSACRDSHSTYASPGYHVLHFLRMPSVLFCLVLNSFSQSFLLIHTPLHSLAPSPLLCFPRLFWNTRHLCVAGFKEQRFPRNSRRYTAEVSPEMAVPLGNVSSAPTTLVLDKKP